MNKRILIIGGVAGGASVAARARRLDAGAEIIMFERGQHVSFSNCALPYYLSGVVGNSDALVMMSPEKFKKSYDIDARVNSEVMAINRDKKTIEIKNTLTGDIHEEAYDVLVMAPGASPVKPRSIGGIDGKNVYTVRNVADIVHLKDGLEAAVKQIGVEPIRVEGDPGSTWIILDYGDIVVHVFYKDTRSYYNLERLWADGEQCDIDKYLAD